MKTPKTVVIVGAVAGGASCAARLRRNEEFTRIVLLEKGPHASFANCGLPYRLGGVIERDEDLLVAKPEIFSENFDIELHTLHEVRGVDPAAKTVSGLNLRTGEAFEFSYDALVLSPGAVPIRPPLPGVELPGIFTVRSIPDIQSIRTWMESHQAKEAVIVGGGFIGLETAENLTHLGLKVTVVEMLDQIMPPLDPEVVRPVEEQLRKNGVQLVLGDGVAGFENTPDNRLAVRTQSGAAHSADVVILSIGVRPDTTLAKVANLKLGARGGISVDDQMRTSDPSIYAVGDAVEVVSALDQVPTLLALAGPANRQGRIAADAISGSARTFRGVQGTSIVGVFDYAVGGTGWTEKALKRAGRTDYEVIWLHPGHHAGYYPGAETLHIKMLYRTSDGLLLGAQVAGKADVARKLDVFAAFLQMNATVFDLEEAEMAYAPQFGGAKDAVNLAGMIAANRLRGDAQSIPPGSTIPSDAVVVDVRSRTEFGAGHRAGAINVPLPELRGRLGELSDSEDVYVYCHSGKRAHDAQRMLSQHGYHVTELAGGWQSWKS